MKKLIRKHLSNALGWRTNRRIVIFESDDWGSIRTRSKSDYDELMAAGLSLDKSNFTRFDCLESNADLERLFDLLFSFKDVNGKHPVITPLCIVANPDFERIQESDFQQYYYEPFTDTCARYEGRDKVHALWLKGIEENIFVPALHGREHFNVKRWMRLLANGHEAMALCFRHQSIGASSYKGVPIPEYLAALDPDSPDDINDIADILRSGSQLFEELCGYRPMHFIAPNKPEPKEMETVLKNQGVKYLTRYKLQKYPEGDGTFTNEFNWLGKQNGEGQYILTRNGGFEPSELAPFDWLGNSLQEIEIAFSWKKPAIISTHRVNYVGGIDPNNRDNGLTALSHLLHAIIKKWPDVEFMSSMELGALMERSH